MPISYDDLLVARLVAHELPDLGDTVVDLLDSRLSPAPSPSLLAELVTSAALTREQANRFHARAEAYKQSRLVKLYVHVLGQRGIVEATVRPLLERLGPRADYQALGAAIVAAGLLPAADEQAVRARTCSLAERDEVEAVEEHLRSRAPEPPAPPTFAIPSWIDTTAPRSGTTIQRYRLLGLIGAGGMGSVYLAEDEEDRTRPVALKLLPADASPEARGRFKREILANSFFSHPGVIDVYDAGEAEDTSPFLAMEFFDGEDLEHRLAREKRLDPAQALAMCRTLFETLAAVHEAGIVHRDVKPANILVPRDSLEPRLMDFGIAIIKNLGEFESAVFQSVGNTLTGTPEYMSPEQALGEKLLPPSDVYSMGLVMFLCLTGRLPFVSETSSGWIGCHIAQEPAKLAEAAPTLGFPSVLQGLFDRVFAKEGADRPTAAEVAIAIPAIIARLGVDEAPPDPAPGRPVAPAEKPGFFTRLWGRGSRP